MKQNRIIALILLAFIIWWGYFTAKLPETTMVGEPGPKFFPSVILGSMTICTIILFFIKDKKKENAKEKSAEEEDVFKDKRLPIREGLKLFAVFFFSILLINFIGYNIGMIIGLTVMLWMIGWKIFPRAIMFSAAVTLVIYFLFDGLMKIPLPAGKLF